MLFYTKSKNQRFFWAISIVLILAGSALFDVFLQNLQYKEQIAQNVFDEESKAESEKAEENVNRKLTENSFEGGDGSDDNNEHIIVIPELFSSGFLSLTRYSYSYYPHINKAVPTEFGFLGRLQTGLFILYHSLVLYDLFS